MCLWDSRPSRSRAAGPVNAPRGPRAARLARVFAAFKPRWPPWRHAFRRARAARSVKLLAEAFFPSRVRVRRATSQINFGASASRLRCYSAVRGRRKAKTGPCPRFEFSSSGCVTMISRARPTRSTLSVKAKTPSPVCIADSNESSFHKGRIRSQRRGFVLFAKTRLSRRELLFARRLDLFQWPYSSPCLVKSAPAHPASVRSTM